MRAWIFVIEYLDSGTDAKGSYLELETPGANIGWTAWTRTE
jgi:hypothetical protein